MQTIHIHEATPENIAEVAKFSMVYIGLSTVVVFVPPHVTGSHLASYLVESGLIKAEDKQVAQYADKIVFVNVAVTQEVNRHWK